MHAGLHGGIRSVPELRRRARRAHLGESRAAGHLEAPALIVGEVQVQAVEVVVGEQVDQPAHVVGGAEVPRDVEHHAAPAERGLARPGAGRNLAPDGLLG